jgi:HEAT repeats
MHSVSTQTTATDIHQGKSIEAVLAEMAKLPPQDFQLAFRRIRHMYPEDVARSCIALLAEKQESEIGRQMFTWLCNTEHYLLPLLDPYLVPLEAAKQLVHRFRERDPKFFTKLLSLTTESDPPIHPRKLRRALDLFDMYGDPDVLARWVRTLTNNPDDRVRSKAVKIFCQFRPNLTLVEQQLASDDSRIRANALEGIWDLKTANVEQIFLRFADDTHHRVVANALVGLFKACPAQQESALKRMIGLTRHPSHLFRRAAIWALTQTLDRRAIPALEALANDPEPAVKIKAAQALKAFPPDTNLEERQAEAVGS